MSIWGEYQLALRDYRTKNGPHWGLIATTAFAGIQLYTVTERYIKKGDAT